MLALDNKVALIAGGSSGIGLAIAKRFVSEGAYVFITSRRQSELDKAVVEIGKNASFTVWRPIHLVGLSHPLGMQAHGDHEPIR